MMIRNHRSERGSVLLLVLWLLIILGLVGLSYSYSVRTQLQVATNEQGKVQAYWTARAGVEKARAMLAATDLATLTDSDPLFNDKLNFADQEVGSAQFSLVVPPVKTGDDPKYGVEDESSKLNVNSASEDMMLLLPGVTEEMADSLIDWRDDDSTPQPLGAENDYYQTLEDPYSARNAPLASNAELMRVRGWDSIFRGAYPDPYTKFLPQDKQPESADPEASRLILDSLTAFSVKDDTAPDGDAKMSLASVSQSQIQQRLGNQLSDSESQAIVTYRNQRQYSAVTDLLDVTAPTPTPVPGGGGGGGRGGNAAPGSGFRPGGQRGPTRVTPNGGGTPGRGGAGGTGGRSGAGRGGTTGGGGGNNNRGGGGSGNNSSGGSNNGGGSGGGNRGGGGAGNNRGGGGGSGSDGGTGATRGGGADGGQRGTGGGFQRGGGPGGAGGAMGGRGGRGATGRGLPVGQSAGGGGRKMFDLQRVGQIIDYFTADQSSGDSSTQKKPGLINLNTASFDVLMTLPGMTEDVAGSIVNNRAANAYQGAGALANVAGMSDSLFRQMYPQVTTKSTRFHVTSRAVDPGSKAVVTVEAVLSAENGQVNVVYWREL